jgi:hypothetical protein
LISPGNINVESTYTTDTGATCLIVIMAMT